MNRKDGLCPFRKTAVGLLVFSSLVGLLALASWTMSASNLFGIFDLSDQQIVTATMSM